MTDCKGDNEGTRALMAQIDSLVIQRDAAEALVRERTMERDNYGQELDKATGMVEMHVDDAEAARMLWRKSEGACAFMDAQRIAALADRDAATARAKKAEALAYKHWRDASYAFAKRDAAERREFALGLQVVAQAQRLRLADGLASASRKVLNEVLAVIADDAGHDEPWFICPHGELFDALSAWDAVPGDGEVIRSALAGRGDRNS